MNRAEASVKRVQVIFHTEQTEGRASKPCRDLVDIDLCEACNERSFREVIHATGAQGNNTYYFETKGDLS